MFFRKKKRSLRGMLLVGGVWLVCLLRTFAREHFFFARVCPPAALEGNLRHLS